MQSIIGFLRRAAAWPNAPVVLLFASVLAFYGCMVDNSLVFAGDGTRILAYIDFIDHSGEIFPLWNPYKVAGLPVMADPERFTLLGYLLDFDDPLFFLKLNLVTLCLVMAFCGALYSFYRACGLSRSGSAFAAFTILTSVMCGIFVYLGRLYAMIGITLTLIILGIFLRSRGAPKLSQQMLIATLTGACIAMTGHYALVMPLGFLFVLAVFYRGFGVAVFEAGKYAVLGILLFAFLILPPFFYNLKTIGIPVEESLGDALSPPATFLNMFMPLDTNAFRAIKGDIFPYVSLLLLPGIALFAASAKKSESVVWKAFVFLAGASLFFLLLGLTPLTWLLDIYESLPLVSHIRQIGSFQYVFVICVMGLAVMGFEAGEADRKKLWQGMLLAGVLFPAALVVLAPGGGGFIRSNAVEIVLYLIFISCGLLLFLRLRKYAILVPIIYIGAALGHLAFGEHVAHERHIDRIVVSKGKETVKHMLPRDSAELATIPAGAFSGGNGYFRIYCDHPMKCPPLGAGGVRGMQGFSLFFSMEARPVLAAFSADNVLHQRPHWMNFRKCDALDPVWLDILNVRYILCRDKQGIPASMNQMGSRGDVDIFLNPDWHSGIRFFSRWKVTAENPTQEQVRENWQKDVAIVNVDPGFSGPQGGFSPLFLSPNIFSEGKIEISLSAPGDGILYLPELYSNDWTVQVDGQDARVLKVFGSFRGVALAKGNHHVAFIYRPLLVYLSLLLSTMTALAFCFYGWRRNHASGTV